MHRPSEGFMISDDWWHIPETPKQQTCRNSCVQLPPNCTVSELKIPKITSNIPQWPPRSQALQENNFILFNKPCGISIVALIRIIWADQKENVCAVQENRASSRWFPKRKNWEGDLALSWAKETFREKNYCCALLMEEAENLAVGQGCVVSSSEKERGWRCITSHL